MGSDGILDPFSRTVSDHFYFPQVLRFALTLSREYLLTKKMLGGNHLTYFSSPHLCLEVSSARQPCRGGRGFVLILPFPLGPVPFRHPRDLIRSPSPSSEPLKCPSQQPLSHPGRGLSSFSHLVGETLLLLA